MITITTPNSMLAPWEAGPEPPVDSPVEATTAAEAAAGEPTPEAVAKAEELYDPIANPSKFNPEVVKAAHDEVVAAQSRDGSGFVSKVELVIDRAAGPNGEDVVRSVLAENFDLPAIFAEEHALLDPIYRVHREILSLLDREKELSAELADIRGELEASRDAKSSLLEALPARLLQIREGLDSETMPAVDAEPNRAPAPQSTDTNPAAPEPPDNAWRAVLTETITTGVVGLGVKKAQTLIDEFPTLGDLEDARARAASSHKHFADQLPKGIGKQSADELAERVMKAQTQGDTRPAAEVVEPRTPAETQSKIKHEQWVRATVANLKTTATEDSLKEEVGESWVDGFDARSAGERATACPRELTAEYQSEWLRGWLHRDLYGNDDDRPVVDGLPGEEVSAADGTDETYGTEEVDAEAERLAEEVHERFISATLDWLNRFPDERMVNAASDREMWQVGCDAYTEGIEPIECPREVAHTSEELAITEAMQVDWLRGWVFEKSLDSETNSVIPPAPRPVLGMLLERSEELQKDEPAAVAEPVAEPAPLEAPAPPAADQSQNIESLAEQVKADPNRKPRIDKEAWDAGYSAAIDDQPLDDYPKMASSESRLDWIRGWVSGSEVSFDL